MSGARRDGPSVARLSDLHVGSLTPAERIRAAIAWSTPRTVGQMGRGVDTILAISRSGDRGARGRRFPQRHFAPERRTARRARFGDLRLRNRLGGEICAFQEVAKTGERVVA